MASLSIVTAPYMEPVSLEEAKLQLRVDGTEEDALIMMLISSARERAEQLTGRQLMTARWLLTLDCFPNRGPMDSDSGTFYPGNEIRLPKSPAKEVHTIRYLGINGEWKEMQVGEYIVDMRSEPARIHLPFGRFWPVTMPQLNAVEVEFSSGYASDVVVPSAIKQWIMWTVASAYKQREADAEKAVTQVSFMDGLLDPYRVVSAL
ncbi:MAG: phage head-tail connector protein [Magnetococcales bacterium]|nr:phage head-tail connector protein [Magnetococcales bacterium]